ncbi:MAG TPA: hypothetical protein VLJ80_05900 [Solirubrobacteraceae bacterium]|nr:hypothetical protein [Solirubrobacteraceae bacterium]
MAKAENLRTQLVAVGKRRREAVEAKRATSHELAALIPRAVKAGIGPSELARLTGLSRQGVRDFTHRHT